MTKFAALAALLCLICTDVQAADKTPNIVLIMADDLGYSDLGCYGGEIETPHLDALAQGGLRYSQFYNTARCWPTRAALLTGYYPQSIRRDAVPGIHSGGGRARPAWAKLMPNYLKGRGYRSYHSGKWHIDGMPLENGFNRSYYLRDQGRFFSPKLHFEDDQKLPPIQPGTGFYGTTAIADHAITYLKQHADEHNAKPFFLYLAFTAPHFPLHALPESIAKYDQRYQVGWEQIRQQRWKRIQQMGVIDGQLSDVEPDVGPPYHFPEALKTLGPGEVNRPISWANLTDEQKKFQAKKMAIHAGMVDQIDIEVGRVVAQLREMNVFDDTLILFLSDNGASAEIMVRADGHDQTAPPGSAATHLCLGPGWSTTCNTPFRRHKTWVHEGGAATPLIAHWPKGISARGEWRHQPGHAIDVVPTILNLADVSPTDVKRSNDAPAFHGQTFAATFDGNTEEESERILWWAHEGNRAIRVGHWKLVSARGDNWSLYDLSGDRTETNDLAVANPERVKELEAEWLKRWKEYQQTARVDLPVEQAKKPVKKLILPGESFRVDGRPAFIMWPEIEKRSVRQPWVWYAPTLPGNPDKHEKWMHEQFLNAGIAVAGIDIGESFGSPQGQKHFDAFYRNLTRQRGFSRKMCLLGRSRGGLMIGNWAVKNPDKVAAVAGIYPVFDLRSYPGIKRAAPAYEMSASDLEQKLSLHNPVAIINVLAKANIPVFLIHGDVDKVVPLEKNSAAVLNVYETLGVKELVQLDVVEGQGHNYWPGFFRSEALVKFAIKHARAAGHSW